jgi:Cu+-exporting ATPase
VQGFPARVRPSESNLAGEADEADRRKAEELRQSLINLGVAWTLALLCCTHHVGHWLHALGYHSLAHGAMMTAMGNPWISGALGAFALLGPGRTLVRDGAVSLYRWALRTSHCLRTFHY